MLRKITPVIISSILLILSFPNFNFEFLAWVAFIPLFFAIDTKTPRECFYLSCITGAIFFLGTIYWLIHVTLPGMVVVMLYLALYFGLFGLISSYGLSGIRKFFPSHERYISLFFIPAAWVATELMRSHMFGGFGWNLLGYSQSYSLPVIQIADIAGIYGVSFMIFLVNTAIFFTIKDIRDKKITFTYLAIALFIVFISLGYGAFRVKNIFTGEQLRIALIQGNIPQTKKWDANFREEILNKYESITRTAASEKIDLVIWPETSVPGFIGSERGLTDRMMSLSKSIKTPILVGAPTEDGEAYYNSAVLLSEDGRILDIYNKMHLVPFGEYVPFKKVLSFVERLAPSPIGDFSFGTKPTVFKFFIERSFKDKGTTWKLVKKIKFSCMICFEDIFPDIARRFVKEDALFLVNITNDAWFMRSSAPYQHVQSSIFRAVENRVNVVRAANTGVSCFIDQKGAITGAIGSEKGSIFIDGFKIHDIVLNNTRTFYTTFGDIFAYICALFVLIVILRTRWKNT